MNRFFIIIAAAIFILLDFNQVGAQRRRPATLPDFDIRAGRLSPEVASPNSRLLRERPQTRLRLSSRASSQFRITNSRQTLSSPSKDDAESISKRFLKLHDDLFRLKAAEIDALKVARRHSTAHNGLTHITLQQIIDGIDIFRGAITLHLDRQGSIVSIDGELTPQAENAINLRNPQLDASESLIKAVEYAGGELKTGIVPGAVSVRRDRFQRFSDDSLFSGKVETRLVYFPIYDDQLRLAWEFTLRLSGSSDSYLILVDAERGSLLYRYNLTWHCFAEAAHDPIAGPPPAFRKHFARTQATSGPRGLVYTRESPRPGSPQGGSFPALVERELLPFNATPYNGSTIFSLNDVHYNWWAGEPPKGLIGNNADARLDRDGNDLPDSPGLTVQDGDFSFPIDFSQQPTAENNQKSALVNLFYWINRYHDILYFFGFDEAAGNFQTNNFNLGGFGNDPMLADGQDGFGFNNASYSGGRDGSPGRIEMFLWTGSPMRDGGLDQTVIIHELTHGLSTRLVGNGDGLTGMQGRGMGEGWSDYFGIVLLRSPQDAADGSFAIGQYPTGDYSRGIRRFPYSTDQQVYPLNFGDISRNTEIHAIGEIWCNTLLEMRALLIKRLGYREGQRQSIQLAVDGMKLTQQTSPTFLDARDAILEADRFNNGGANQCSIWQAFSKRGMGYSASTLDSNDGSPRQAFDAPPFCSDLGSIQLDRKNYAPGETVNLTLGDGNAVAPVRIRAVSSMTGDEETITLTPDPVSTGSFRAGLRVLSGAPAPGDGALQVSVALRDKIIISYLDRKDGNGAQTTVISEAEVTGEKIVFEDFVERGNAGWISVGSPTPVWSIADESANNGSRVWTDSAAGNYGNNADASLISPLFDLSPASSVVINFSHRFNLEKGLDYGIVEYSIDDGETWARGSAFTGLQTSYTQAAVVIDELAGQSRARIRFRLKTDSSGIADGWSIDDIRVIARSSDASYLPDQSELSPVIATISPAFGPPEGGTTVRIAGANFTDVNDLKVFFGDTAATNLTVSSESMIIVKSPPHRAGATAIRLQTRRGSSALANAFTYFVSGSGSDSPELISLFPGSGSTRGGTVVTLNGLNFTPDSSVSFGSQPATVTFINSGLLRAVSPAPPGSSTGPVDLRVRNSPSHQFRLANAFNYVPPTPPSLQLIGPNGGEAIYAGSAVTIRWQSSDNSLISKHKIEFFRNGVSSPQLIADNLPGAAQTFNWTIPPSMIPTAQARIRITAIDDEGAETRATSAHDFRIDQRWEAFGNLSRAVQRPGMASDGKYIYLFGGRTTNGGNSTTAAVQRLDPGTGQPPQPAWTIGPVPQMPGGLNASDAVYLKEKIYIPGGVNQQTEIDGSHFAYDPSINIWTHQASAPVQVYNYALAADADRGVYYLTGGSGKMGAVTNVQVYDPRTDSWTQLPAMGSARYGHEAAMIDGKLFVAGGGGSIGGLSSCEFYDFSTKKWSPIADLSRPRRYAISAITADSRGRVYWLVIGGEDPNTGAAINSVEAYDLQNDRWSTLDPSFYLPTARTQLAGTVHNGYLYAAGGAIQLSGSNVTSPVSERIKLSGIEPAKLNQHPIIAVPTIVQAAAPFEEILFEVSANDLGSEIPVTIEAWDLPDGASFTVVNETNNSARGFFKWTPKESDLGKVIAVAFAATDGTLSDVKRVVIRVVAAAPLAAVNAADFRVGPLARDSIAAAFGVDLASTTEAAKSLPLPLSLAGVTLTVNGAAAPLLFVSPTQINFITPPSAASGKAVIIAVSPTGKYSTGNVEIMDSAPAIFTANASGNGDAAALATSDGISYQQQPFDATAGGRPNILVLYGTGIRRAQAANPNDDNGVAESVSVTIDGLTAKVLYAGAQGSFSGLDQINIEFPPGLAAAGRRRVEVVMTVNGIRANIVTIEIK